MLAQNFNASIDIPRPDFHFCGYGVQRQFDYLSLQFNSAAILELDSGIAGQIGCGPKGGSIEEIRDSIKLSREVSFDEISDLSILREAQRELGIKEK